MSDTRYSKAPNEPPPSYDAAPLPPPVTSSASGNRPQPRLPLPLDLPSLNQVRSRRAILASASPRRKQLLSQIGLTNLEIIPSTVPENFPKTLTPFEYVLQTALQKAMTVYKQELNSRLGDPGLVLAADTVVVSHSGHILEKPRSEKEHVAMLKELRDTGGGKHKVLTAVACMAPLESARDPGYALETLVEETTVVFDGSVTDELLMAYVRTREGADKAGGYGIQGIGSILVEKVDGDYNNVVGLPLRGTLKLIEKVLRMDEEDEDELAHFDEVDEEPLGL